MSSLTNECILIDQIDKVERNSEIRLEVEQELKRTLTTRPIRAKVKPDGPLNGSKRANRAASSMLQTGPERLNTSTRSSTKINGANNK